MEKKHKDCLYYLRVDVFKGICKREKTKIQADEDACKSFEQIEQCRYCTNYTPVNEELGLCMNRADTYPELIARTCTSFSWKIKK